MDTAGFNLLEAENALEPGSLKERYPEFAYYEGKCRFRECLHDREPGCAVTQAAEQGKSAGKDWNDTENFLRKQGKHGGTGMIKIAPSILAADPLNLEKDIRMAEKAGCDWIHVDIMDAHFVPNLAYSVDTVRRLREVTSCRWMSI